MGLEGKVAIVTGAGQSLGRAIARVLAGRGAAVMLTGRTRSKLEAVADEIRGSGGTAELDQGDVGSRPDVERMVARAAHAFGGIDILVNNAQAWERDRPLAQVTDDILEIPLRSGLYGSLYTMQACYPHFKARGGGSVINFGSSTGVAGMPGWAPYGIAKEAIRGLTRVAAKEWGPDNIRVNTICPAAFTGSSITRAEQDPEAWARHLTTFPLGRLGDPEQDIGRAVAALADGDLDYLTGATLMLDGGKLLID